ncbi:hypothetical protein BAUCODRAFT_55153, partial [Baudoinia panamericana UAMH 10762]
QESCSSTLSGKKIIVSGAGIAGLAFVNSLRKIWTDDLGTYPIVTLYERDVGPPDVGGGYTISIRSAKGSEGIQTMQKLCLLARLLSMSITREGDERRYFGDWVSLVKVRGAPPGGVPKAGMRVARRRLRKLLLDAAAERGSANVVWGVACVSAVTATDGTVRVELSNGYTDQCDLLVVADGINSKIRGCIRPNDQLHFAGPVSVHAISNFPKPPPKPVDRDWGLIPNGRGAALFVSPMDERTANWSLSYLADKPRPALPPNQRQQLLEEVRQLGDGLQEPFQTLLKHTNASTFMIHNSMDKKPFAHGTANGVPDGIVFIGDSNHGMSPFAGNGANLALTDGYDLAECICSYTTIQQAVQAYDERSLSRATASLRISHDLIRVVHSSGIRWILYRTAL